MNKLIILFFFSLFSLSCSESTSEDIDERDQRTSAGDLENKKNDSTDEENLNCETRCQGKTMIACIDGKEVLQECRFGCDGNQCRPCTAGSLFCADDQSAVFLCSTDGQRYSKYQNCSTNLCKQGSCKICESEDLRCMGSKIQRCQGGYNWVFEKQCEGTCKKNGQDCTIYTGPDINAGLLCQSPGSDPVDGPLNWVETIDCGSLETRFQKISDSEIIDHALEGLWTIPSTGIAETYSQASDRCLAQDNSRKLSCGLPNIPQLISLTSLDLNNEYFASAIFSQLLLGDFYWSSSRSKTKQTWWLSFKNGYIDYAKEDQKAYALCFCPDQ